MTKKVEPKRNAASKGRGDAPASSEQLRQILGGLIQGIVLADTRGRITWANQAALDAHGCTQEPELLLSAAAYRKHFALRYRNHHTLTAALYPLDRLAAGKAFDELTVIFTRRDRPDPERVLQMRGLLIEREPGHAESAALIIKDVTEQANAQERFERSFAANPAPALILSIPDSRYIKANRGFLEMTGYSSDEVVGHAFHELDVLKDAERRDDAVAALREHATITQQEALLHVKSGHDKYVIVAGQPIDMDGTPCMLFTFNDLDQRKQAESALRASEENFRKAFQLAPVPMLICEGDGWHIKEANEAFVAVSGYAVDALRGQALAELRPGRQKRLPNELQAMVRAGTGVRNREIRLATGAGTEIDCVLSAEPVTMDGQARILCVVQDITERKRSEADLFEAIEAVMKDTSWFSRTMIEKLAQVRHAGSNEGGLADLTARERQVLELVCKGQTNTQIAATLGLSTNTVRNHIATLYSKIGVNRRSAAVIWGRERGLLAY